MINNSNYIRICITGKTVRYNTDNSGREICAGTCENEKR